MLGSRVGPAIRRVGVVVGALLLCLTAGCQSNPEPAPLEAAEPSSSAPSSASPTPSPPAMPAEAKAEGAAGAKAFVRHYFATLNFAMNSGRTGQLRKLSAEECESCQAIAGNIERTYRAGGNINSKGWRLTAINVAPVNSPRQPILDLGVRMTSERVVKSAGAQPEWFDGGRQAMTIFLKRHDGSWHVTRLDQVA